MVPAVSVNAKSLWLDECDNRTHLSSDTVGGVAKTPEETYAVQLREFCKNVSHNSGLWYMDLGGNWYNDPGIIENIERIVSSNQRIRRMSHHTVAEITVIVDESAVLKTHPSRIRKTENLIRELQLCGAPIDIIFSHDVGARNLKKSKLAVLLTPYYMTEDEVRLLKKEISEMGKLLFVGGTRVDASGAFTVGEDATYQELRKLVEQAGVTCLAPKNCTVYADSRVVSFFPREDMTFVPHLPKDQTVTDLLTGEPYSWGTPMEIRAGLGRAFITE